MILWDRAGEGRYTLLSTSLKKGKEERVNKVKRRLRKDERRKKNEDK